MSVTLGFFQIGGGEMVVILLVALLVLGPDKLPEASRQIGRAMAQFRQMAQGFQKELESVRDEITETEARVRGEIAAAAKPAVPPVPSVQDPVRADDAAATGENDAPGVGSAVSSPEPVRPVTPVTPAEPSVPGAAPSVPFTADAEPNRQDKPRSAAMPAAMADEASTDLPDAGTPS